MRASVCRQCSQATAWQQESDPERVKTFYDNGLRELEVLRRAAIVNSLYGGRKLVVERSGAEDKVELERGDN